MALARPQIRLIAATLDMDPNQLGRRLGIPPATWRRWLAKGVPSGVEGLVRLAIAAVRDGHDRPDPGAPFSP